MNVDFSTFASQADAVTGKYPERYPLLIQRIIIYERTAIQGSAERSHE